MAERVAPVLDPERTMSRPERQRGRGRRWFRRVLGLVLVVMSILLVALTTAHFLILEGGARQVRATALIPDGELARALVVVAHPGDELEVAGTVKELADSGVGVMMLSLTRGEQRPPALSSFSSSDLARVRSEEFARSAQDVLGARRARVADNPDGTLLSGDPAGPVADIEAAIKKFHPSVIITVPDVAAVDTDSQATLALVTRAAQQPRSSVARVWSVTRSPREISWLNRVFGPVLNPQALAPAAVAVRIQDAGPAKAGVLLANGTQSPDLGRDYPWAESIPPVLYFRFLDREYFQLLWGQPLS